VVESQPSKLLVAGSIPVSRSMFSRTPSLGGGPNALPPFRRLALLRSLASYGERIPQRSWKREVDLGDFANLETVPTCRP